MAGDGVRLQPDIVLNLKNKTFVLDVSTAWDASSETLEVMCASKEQNYQPSVPALCAETPGKQVKVHGL